MNTQKCPVCNLPGTKNEGLGNLNRKTFIDCPRCGEFIITYVALSTTNFESLSPELSAWIREFKEKGAGPPELDTDSLKMVKDSFHDYTPSQKQLILMRNIERRTDYPGRPVNLVPEHDFPLAWATCEQELLYYLKNMADRDLLNLPSKGHSEINDLLNVVEISALGWEYLDKHSGKSAISDQAFVAMSFSGNIDSAWENAIKEAIEAAGYKAYRIDREPHDERIDVKIMAEIKNSKFLIADVTEQRQGIYFEAGYALGLGIPVIWSCRKDDFKNRHFDTRQYNHIVWETEDQLKEELFNFIRAIIG